jgi:hypothetical protein
VAAAPHSSYSQDSRTRHEEPDYPQSDPGSVQVRSEKGSKHHNGSSRHQGSPRNICDSFWTRTGFIHLCTMPSLKLRTTAASLRCSPGVNAVFGAFITVYRVNGEWQWIAGSLGGYRWSFKETVRAITNIAKPTKSIQRKMSPPRSFPSEIMITVATMVTAKYAIRLT